MNQQENVKIVKSVAAVPAKTKRPVLSEISNKVNTLRGVQPIDRTSLLHKDNKKKVTVLKRQVVKPTEKVSEKPPVQVVKTVVKTVVKAAPSNEITSVPNENFVPEVSVTKKKEPKKAFSTDLLKFEDIDEQDKKNPILVSIYTNDIHNYLRELEGKFPIKSGYLMGQELTPRMRSVLIDWLVKVHQQFRLMQETLYLTVAIIDRFLQVQYCVINE